MPWASSQRCAPARPEPRARATSGSSRGDVADGLAGPAPERLLASSAPRPTAATPAAARGTPRRSPAAPRAGRWAWRSRRRSSPTNFTAAIPAEAGSPSSLGDPRADARGRSPPAAPNSCTEAVTSRNASSSDSGSISGVYALEDREHLLAGLGVGAEARRHDDGVRAPARSARAIGIALRTPKGRTSYEAASTTPRWGARRRSPACRAGWGRRAARPTRRTRPCRRG